MPRRLSRTARALLTIIFLAIALAIALTSPTPLVGTVATREMGDLALSFSGILLWQLVAGGGLFLLLVSAALLWLRPVKNEDQ